ncbi:hypothetical protein BPOR_0505g00080 [Botrytis porri]|uniref:Uncharacterized protein n=1 Tax=Botrytis porri TaxID=87229 RepID=A0A4Z1KRC9_9HELO|nr:hypothetical protein BPOR_0505g00080 [Botrytis porri]
MSSHIKKASVSSPPLIMASPISKGSKRPAAALSSDTSSNSVNSIAIPSKRSKTGKRLDSQAESSSSGSIHSRLPSEDPDRYKTQGIADLATYVNDYKGCPIFEDFDFETMAQAFQDILRADFRRVTEQKALKEGVLHAIQHFEVPDGWFNLPKIIENMEPSHHRPFADIIGDMLKTSSIRITDAAGLTVEEVLDWEAKNQDTRADNA